MCCTGGRRSWQGTVNRVGLFVYLFAALPCENGKGVVGSGPLPSNIWEFAEPRAAMSGHIMACSCGPKSIFSSISSWIVPLAGVQERTSAQWAVGENAGVDRREGPDAFFQFTTIRNRFPTISLNWLGALLIKGAETVGLRQPWKCWIYDCWLRLRAAWCSLMYTHHRLKSTAMFVGLCCLCLFFLLHLVLCCFCLELCLFVTFKDPIMLWRLCCFI